MHFFLNYLRDGALTDLTLAASWCFKVGMVFVDVSVQCAGGLFLLWLVIT